MFDIRSLTWDEWSYPGVILPIVTLGTIRPRIARLRKMTRSFSINCTAKPKSLAVWACLGVDPLDMPRTPSSGEWRKTLLTTHHALSPPPSHHHLYIIHLIKWLKHFYRITMSLKRPFMPKSDVKQWFTTTTSSLVASLPQNPTATDICPWCTLMQWPKLFKSMRLWEKKRLAPH